ncbi:sperm acrosome membrane-associated protein 6 [Patagioenas fasciata]|uniref:sperm acrosome membrane-associated protein 6 n=1 Tax=Patagioenas fasciata TaxID=372321 RepID=UPI0032E8ABF2
MGWWCAPMMLLLVPWLPGVHPCLLCFLAPTDQRQLCRYITGTSAKDTQHQLCLEALLKAAEPLASVIVGEEQHMALQKIIMDAVDFVKKQKGKKSFQVSLKEAIKKIWVKLSQMKEAPACIPPCGNQKAARVFQCATCHIMHCPFPLDCPVQEVWARADEVVTLHCDVPFAVPPNWSITWMFAKDMRTQDLTLFEELQTSEEGPLSLTLWGPVQGTFACRLADLYEPFIRKYFYLNVSGQNVEAEQGLQARLRVVLRWPHDVAPLHPMAWLGLGLALGSMTLVMLLGTPTVPLGAQVTVI